MTFKIGDTVKVIATEERLAAIFINGYSLTGKKGRIKNISTSDKLSFKVEIDGTEWLFAEQDLEMVDTVRTFESGATRDTDLNKLDFEGFNNPIVEERYAEYLNEHRVQSDGKLRDSDNWQKLFGDNHFAVCMKSAFRHFIDVWKIHRGYTTFDRKTDEKINQEDAICGVIFNMKAYLLKLLQDKNNA